MTLHTAQFIADYKERYQADNGGRSQRIANPPARSGGMVCSVCSQRSANGCYYPHPLDATYLLCVDCTTVMYDNGTSSSLPIRR